MSLLRTRIPAALIALASSSSHAAVATLQSLSASPECGPLESAVKEEDRYDDLGRGYIGESLQVFFEQFVVTTEARGRRERHCNLTAKVGVPAGYRFRPTLAFAEGFYNIQDANVSQGGIKVSYVVQPSGQRAERSNPKPFTGTGDILCKAELANARFTTCYNKPTAVTLTTDLGLWLDQKSDGASLIQLDTSRENGNLTWNWQFQSCENFYDQKVFDSAYVAYNGRTYGAKLSFDVTKGRYESTAGFTGDLYDIRYSEDGLTVDGKWRVGSQSGGFFRFVMSDVSTGQFAGEWGDANGFRARWTGRLASASVATAKVYHSFRTPQGSLCLDVTDGSTADQAAVVARRCHFGSNQLFSAPNVYQQSFFHLKSKKSGQCVTARPDGQVRGGYRLVQTLCGESHLDGWEFYVRGQSPFRLKNRATGQCLVFRGQTVELADCDREGTFLVWSRH